MRPHGKGVHAAIETSKISRDVIGGLKRYVDRVKLEPPCPVAGWRVLLEIDRVEDRIESPSVEGMPTARRIEIPIVEKENGVRRDRIYSRRNALAGRENGYGKERYY